MLKGVESYIPQEVEKVVGGWATLRACVRVRLSYEAAGKGQGLCELSGCVCVVFVQPRTSHHGSRVTGAMPLRLTGQYRRVLESHNGCPPRLLLRLSPVAVTCER